MPASINLGATAVPTGSRQFLIDGLPGNSQGFELTAGLNASWTGATGKLFDLTIEIALDGVNFVPWITGSVNGGPVLDKAGAAKSTWNMVGTWPGGHDGSANPFGRKVLRAASLRATLTVAQVFSITSLTLRTV